MERRLPRSKSSSKYIVLNHLSILIIITEWPNHFFGSKSAYVQKINDRVTIFEHFPKQNHSYTPFLPRIERKNC